MAQRVAQINQHLNYAAGLLSNQVAIITGAGQGIGADTARVFAAEGAKVVICDIDSAKAEAVADEINSAEPGRAICVAGDIQSGEYIDMLVQRASQFGNGKIHIILNNAGFTWDGVIHKISDRQWEAMIAIHNTAPFRLVRAAAPFFRVNDGEQRCIINISSTSGTHGNAGQANYASAKSGIIGLTKTIAKEWGRYNVRANAVSFGSIDTRLTRSKGAGEFITTESGDRVELGVPMGRSGTTAPDYNDIPLKRMGQAKEAANCILAVASPLFSYVTGQVIEVNGGKQM